MRKAKIISYKNIEETQVTHIIKDTTKGQKKLGQKYKSAVPEIDELEAEAELEIAHIMKEVITGKRKRGRKPKSAVQEADEPEPEQEVAQTTDAPKPWRAPVARMY